MPVSCESRGDAEGPLATSKRDKERVTTRSEHMQNLEHLKRNAVWYEANLDALLPKYQGRYVAIADGKVYGASVCASRRGAPVGWSFRSR